MLDYALKVCKASETIDEEDFKGLAEHGFSQDDIWDIGAIAAFFAMSKAAQVYSDGSGQAIAPRASNCALANSTS